MSIDRRLIRQLAAALLLSTAGSALAAPRLDSIVSDHAVLQRGQPLRITGSAEPGEQLRLTLAGAKTAAKADKNGRWFADFPAMQAGGPFTLDVEGANGARANAEDLLIGDVWLCSGQSNMEFRLSQTLNGPGEIAGANDPQLRIVKIAQQTAASPKAEFEKTPSWSAITPANAGDFSAACYFMAREYRKSKNVAIGAIDDTWGGTPIRAWTNLAGVSASGGGKDAALVESYARDPVAAQRAFSAGWDGWWRKQTGNAIGQEPWHNSNALSWKPMPSYDIVDNWGPQWVDWGGAFWARRTITLTPEEAKTGATLSLGAIDDMDRTYVNGVMVGSTNMWDTPRNYAVPAKVLKPGANEVLIYVRDVWGPGGFRGPADTVKIAFADGHSKPILDAWQYSLIPDSVGTPPVAPWEGSSGVSTIYNAMVAPLGPIALKGVAWYQGEADVGQPGYDKRLAAMFANWRTQFRNPNLPFLIVGLAGFGTPRATPIDSGWAATVDEQRKGVMADKAAALVPAIDLGEWYDIHPANKQDVGKRLALAGKSIAYGDSKGQLSPLPLSATRSGANVVVAFSKPLQVLGSGAPAGFELCGAASGSCRFREGVVNGNQVTISGDGQPATRVRYAWADFPIVNLYDTDLLPASSFELPIN